MFNNRARIDDHLDIVKAGIRTLLNCGDQAQSFAAVRKRRPETGGAADWVTGLIETAGPET